MPTPLFIQATLHDGPNFGTVLVPYVDALPLEATTSRAIILDQLVGVNVPGMYIYDNSQTWRYAMPIEAVSAIVVGGDACDLYIDVSQTFFLGPTTIVYRNGQLQTGHDVVPANAVYAVRTPNSATQGSVTSVNGMTGDVVLTAQDITGFATVAYSGLYSDLVGAPDPYTLPVSTSTTLGGVLVPNGSNIKIDTQGNIDLDPAIITKLNGAFTAVQTSGTGASLINTQASGTLTLKSLKAGTNVTITDDGAGTLTVSSTGGGGNISSAGTGVSLIDSQTAQETVLRSLLPGTNIALTPDGNGNITVDAQPAAASTQLIGDVTGTGTGTVPTVLANSGVSAGDYTKVTVDAKGRVTGGTNPTTLAGFGITDALPTAGGSMLGNIVMTTGSTVTGVPDPVAALDAVNKQSLDAAIASAANGASWREAVAAATTTNLAALSGTFTVDGYALQVGDRILVKDQTTQTDNGAYDVAAGAWTRSTDSSTGAELFHSAYLVINGTVNGLTQWTNTNGTTPTVGTDSITFGQLKAKGNEYTAGAGLALSGLQFSIAPTGVAAGAYAKVTVNTLGQVISGSGLTSSDVTTALGYTPYNGTTNPSGFIGQLSAAGDATGTTTIAGSAGTLNLTLSNSGVTAGVYTSVTVDAKGRVTAGGQITPSQITSALGFTPVNKAGDTLAGALNLNPITTVASATTTNIGAAASNLLSISGTTAITGFDAASGALRMLVFQGALTLTHNATGIILPGAANITTAAGDVATFVNVGGSTWRCLAYTKADGTPIKGGGGSPYTTVQIFNGSTTDLAAEFTNAVELVRVTGSAPATNFDVQLGSVQMYTSNTSANWLLNFRFNSTQTLNNVLSSGMSITTALIVQNGASGFYPSTIQIDGATVTPKWQGGVAPSSGTANAFDIYTFTIIKSGASSYTVFASQVSYQ